MIEQQAMWQLTVNAAFHNAAFDQYFNILANPSFVREHEPRKRRRITTVSHINKCTMASQPFSTDRDRWSAVVGRNPDAVGSFVYAVKTTKIYCRPDCKARLARQANVIFYTNPALAEAGGYRACKRCKPDLLVTQEEDPLMGKIRQAVALVEETASRGEKISLQELSRHVGISKWHLQRVFKRLQGRTPHQMQTAILNSERGSEEPQQPATVNEADGSASREDVSQTDRNLPGPSDLRSPDLDVEAQPREWLVSESARVDEMLKDLFPELYET
jgi:methylphosphotriester-DNA--protein-cysteine methyltransferase